MTQQKDCDGRIVSHHASYNNNQLGIIFDDMQLYIEVQTGLLAVLVLRRLAYLFVLFCHTFLTFLWLLRYYDDISVKLV